MFLLLYQSIYLVSCTCYLILSSQIYQKLIILVQQIVHILKIPKEDIIFVNKTIKPKAISNELARFHVDLNKELKGQKTARYIVATSSAFAVGLILAEVILVGFQELDYRAATML